MVTSKAPPPSGQHPTVVLADYLAGMAFDEVPSQVIEAARHSLLDTLGVGLAASVRPWARMAQDLAVGTGASTGAVIWGTPIRTASHLAALANGTAAHGIEMDDRHPIAQMHAGSMLIPAALAVAESRRISGRELLMAVIAGYEAGYRVGRAVPTRQGIHPPGHKGVWSTTAAAARAAGLAGRPMVNAFGLAASMASGISEFSEDPAGTMVKRLHGGLAATHGVLATELAQLGMTGPISALEGEYGYAKAFGDPDKVDLALVTEDLGERWEIVGRELKPYAAWGGSHTAIEAIGGLMAEAGLAAADVSGLRVDGSARLITQHRIARPESLMAAQYSLPFLAALAAVRGPDALMSPDEVWTDDVLEDPVIIALAARVELVIDPQIAADSQRTGHYGGARVTISTADGDRIERMVLHSKGTAHNPMTPDEISQKFMRLASRVLGEDCAGALRDTIARVEELDDISSLTEQLVVTEEETFRRT